MRILIYTDDTEHGLTSHWLQHDIVSQGDTVEAAVEEILTVQRTFDYLVGRGEAELPPPAAAELIKRWERGESLLVPQAGVEVRLG